MGFQPKIVGRHLPFRFNYYFMLAALVGFFVFLPIGATVMSKHAWTLHLFFCLLLFSGVLAVETSRRIFVVSIVLASGVFLLGWAPFVIGTSTGLRIAYLIFNLLFVLLTAAVLLRSIFSRGRVTPEAICAALCVYFLIGLVWSLAYNLLDQVKPDSFNYSGKQSFLVEVDRLAQERGLDRVHAHDVVESMVFTYFSLVTLTTVGYGDITPAKPFAMMLASIQGFLGQIYIAVLVAWLVGVQVSTSIIARQNIKPDE